MKRFLSVVIAVYILAGTVWLVAGSALIRWMRAEYPHANLRYLYDVKNVLFLIISVISILLIVNSYYKRLLLKERVLNKQLSQREEQLSSLLHDYGFVNKATNDVIWEYNIQNDELKWLSGYGELFGYEDHSVDKGTFWNMPKIHEEDRETVIAMFRDLLPAGNQQWETEYRFRCRDGSYKYVFDRGYLILNEQGKPVRMLGAIQDIDAKKRYSRELEEQNTKLREIAWLNSHTVRRPLCNITGLVPLIKASVDDPDALLQLVSHLETSARELDETIHQVNEHAEL